MAESDTSNPFLPPPPAEVGDAPLLDWALGHLEGAAREQVERALAEQPALRRRADAVRQTLALLDHWEPGKPDRRLADRINRRVAAVREPRPVRRLRPSIFSLAEVVGIAAALLLMASIFIPSVIKFNTRRQQMLCMTNMRRIGTAMEQYANENANMLPFLSLTGNWLQRDNGRHATGTAPLFLLAVRQGGNRIVSFEDFVCPAGDDQPFRGQTAGLVDFPSHRFCSYSFQNFFGTTAPIPRIDPNRGRPQPVLADRNPLFRSGQVCRDVSGAGNSLNHGGSGQHVLYNDGRVHWESNPQVGIDHDNIWLAGDRQSYTGTEASTGADDSFLAP